MYSTFAYAKKSADASFEKITISRNEPGDDDVQFDIGRYTVRNIKITISRNEPGDDDVQFDIGRHTLLEISRSPYPGMSPGMKMFSLILVGIHC